jgi:integrase
LLSGPRPTQTARSYKAAEVYWKAWFERRFHAPLLIPLESPLPVECILQFVVDHIEVPGQNGHQPTLPVAVDQSLVDCGFKASRGALSLATVRQRISLMSGMHAHFGTNNPCRSLAVVQLVAAVRKAQADHGITQRRSPAVKRKLLDQLLATCDKSLIGLRDRALLLFFWASGGRRRSEAVLASVENTRRQADGSFQFELMPAQLSEGYVEGPKRFAVDGQAAVALDQWLAASGIRTGPLFCRIRRGNKIVWENRASGLAVGLKDHWLNAIVKSRCGAAGVPGSSLYSSRSLRNGFVGQALDDQISVHQALRMTGLKSLKMFMVQETCSDRTAGD